MNITDTIIGLLRKKLALFSEFEHYTELLSECDIDCMSNYITNRTAIANQIDEISKSIIDACKTAEVTPAADSIVNNKCKFSEIPDNWKPVFEISQEIFGCANRCVEMNTHVTNRMILLREHLKQRICETQNTPKIKKYLSASGAANSQDADSIRTRRI